jgi:hypothetical protein
LCFFLRHRLLCAGGRPILEDVANGQLGQGRDGGLVVDAGLDQHKGAQAKLGFQFGFCERFFVDIVKTVQVWIARIDPNHDQATVAIG